MSLRRLSIIALSTATLALVAPACSSDDTRSKGTGTDTTHGRESTAPPATDTVAPPVNGAGSTNPQETDPPTSEPPVTNPSTTEASTTSSTASSIPASSTNPPSSLPPGPASLADKSTAAAATLTAIQQRFSDDSPTDVTQPGACPLIDDPSLTSWAVEPAGSVFCESDDGFAIGVTIDPEARTLMDEFTANPEGEIFRNEPYAGGNLVVGCMVLPGMPVEEGRLCVAAWFHEASTVLAGGRESAELEPLLVNNLESLLDRATQVDPASIAVE